METMLKECINFKKLAHEYKEALEIMPRISTYEFIACYLPSIGELIKEEYSKIKEVR